MDDQKRMYNKAHEDATENASADIVSVCDAERNLLR